MNTTTTTSKHELDGRTASGNGHHGHCKHCGLAMVTDLGYDSWAGVKCIDRPITQLQDFPPPQEVRSYAEFNGLRFDGVKQTFVKPYGKKYSVDELLKIVNSLTDAEEKKAALHKSDTQRYNHGIRSTKTIQN